MKSLRCGPQEKLPTASLHNSLLWPPSHSASLERITPNADLPPLRGGCPFSCFFELASFQPGGMPRSVTCAQTQQEKNVFIPRKKASLSCHRFGNSALHHDLSNYVNEEFCHSPVACDFPSSHRGCSEDQWDFDQEAPEYFEYFSCISWYKILNCHLFPGKLLRIISTRQYLY